jgi:hypothetical protein
MSEAPKKEVSAIGYSITTNIDGNRQIVFQHFIAADATDAQVNADLDRLMALVDRQRAKYEIPDAQAELDKMREEISQFTEDKEAIAEANYQKGVAAADVELATLRSQREKVINEAQAAHRNNGRQGAFKPIGHVKTTLERIDTGIEQIVESKGKMAAERDFYVQNVEANIQRRRDRVVILQEKIDRLTAQVT